MIQPEKKYGPGPNQIDEFFKEKRQWSETKDKILGDYIDCYLKTVTGRHQPIIIVDGFAGPGKFGDDTDGSPLIICKAIDRRSSRTDVGIGCVFADNKAVHRQALEILIENYIQKGIASRPLMSFSEALTYALKIGSGSTLFFYLDPYGIKDMEFDTVRQIYDRSPSQSTEVLINFSYPTVMRMSGNWSYGDSPEEVSRRVKQAKVETLNRYMGGDYWLDIVTNPHLDKTQREDIIVRAYTDRVRKFFKYAYSIPVKELETSPGVPADDTAKYHLVFGTRSSRAVQYMNDVAISAIRPYLNQFEEGLLFAMTPERFVAAPIDEVKAAIVKVVEHQPMKRPGIYEAIIPTYFLQYRTPDYRKMIEDLVFRERRLFADPRTLKTKNHLNNETLIAAKPWTS
jgi:three-Cys-motif partner protein